MSATKFCSDCRFYQEASVHALPVDKVRFAKCLHPKSISDPGLLMLAPQMVKLVERMFCNTMRNSEADAHCGAKGRLFEAHPAESEVAA